ncbi:MAG: hypothetical protein VYC42_07910 [Pseudomonadota bacterium]|nr:hypothetical protein [Pseudomonadota bacterium]
MARREKVTAVELMAQLRQNPAYQARVAAQEEQRRKFHAEYADEDAQLAAEARTLGYDIKSVWDFVDSRPTPFDPPTFRGDYGRAYPMLVRHLALPHHHRVREGIIRALTVKDGGSVVSNALYEQFTLEEDENLRWTLANALLVAMPLKERKQHPEIAAMYRGKGAF